MVKRINIKERGPINLYFIGDLHAGAKNFARKEFEETIKIVQKDTRARVILMGDYGDYIESDDKRRYNPSNIDPNLRTAMEQTAYVKKQFTKIKSKIYGMLTGNHEQAYAKYHKELFNNKTRDYAEYISKKLNIPFLEEMGIINLKINNYKYNIVAVHGAGGGTNFTSYVGKMKNIISSFKQVPNIAAMGHIHALQTLLNPRMNYKFDTQMNHIAFTGNYYRTYKEKNMNYASSNLYNPLPVGCVMYNLDGKGNIKDNKIIF